MLVIDIGNSRIKWALYIGEPRLFHVHSQSAFDYTKENFEDQLNQANLPITSSTIEISCVVGDALKMRMLKWLGKNNRKKVNFAQTQAQQCNITNSYVRPGKMGVDRWLAMIAAFDLHAPEHNEILCVIDCGTAITLDMLNARGQHLGGTIMPGFKTMIQSLVNNTSDIEYSHLLVRHKTLKEGLANTTHDAILKGCTQLIVGGLFNMVWRNQTNASTPIKCIITGGDGKWVANALKLSLDATPNVELQTSYNPYLVLQGLVIAALHDKT
ncbi:Pantothenate kinase type III, CoaX-like [hydrothermal vent metagenome]|uniref:Type III pantothenate kinase n=1 Tax=hydrothermal vent metagenome TaxID=652676 RepID=A0A3B0XJM2_9ZZZZ